MRRKPLLALLIALLGFLAAGSLRAQRERPTTRQWQERAEAASKGLAGRMRFDEAPTKLLKRAVRYAVYLPPGYDDPAQANTRYPVMFFLHGLFEDPERWVARGGAELLDRAIAKKDFPPCILVVASAGFTFYCDTLDGSHPYGRFYIEEFVPFVDKTYRTFGDRAHRLIAGSSMGGFGALKFAFQRPELFVAVAVHSAALLPDDMSKASMRAQRAMDRLSGQLADLFGDPLDQNVWNANNPMALAKKLKPDTGLAIYFDCGSEDSYGFDEGCRELAQLLTTQKVPHETAIRPGGHGWEFLRDSFPHSLAFMKKVLMPAKSPDPTPVATPKKSPEVPTSRPGGN